MIKQLCVGLLVWFRMDGTVRSGRVVCRTDDDLVGVDYGGGIGDRVWRKPDRLWVDRKKAAAASNLKREREFPPAAKKALKKRQRRRQSVDSYSGMDRDHMDDYVPGMGDRDHCGDRIP